MGWHEIAGLAPLMVLIVAIGVYPRPFFEQIQPATSAPIKNYENQSLRLQEDANPISKMPRLNTRTGGRTPPRRQHGAAPSPEAKKAGDTPKKQSGDEEIGRCWLARAHRPRPVTQERCR